MGFGLQVGDDRHFADVERALAHHRGENLVDRLDLRELEGDGRRGNGVRLQWPRMRIIAERRAKLRELPDTHGRLLPPGRSANAFPTPTTGCPQLLVNRNPIVHRRTAGSLKRRRK